MTRGQRVIRKTSVLWSTWMELKSTSLWGEKEAVGGQGAFVNLGMDATGCQSAPWSKVLRFAQPEATSTTVDSRQSAAALEINPLDCSFYIVKIGGHHHASATQYFISNWVNCNCQDCNLCSQFVLVLVCFHSLVGFKTRIKVAGGHSVLFQWHDYILRHKTHRKTYWQTDTKQDCQVECVHHTTATHCH